MVPVFSYLIYKISREKQDLHWHSGTHNRQQIADSCKECHSKMDTDPKCSYIYQRKSIFIYTDQI